MRYLIMINEVQREQIERALVQLSMEQAPFTDESGLPVVETLVSMLGELPTDEAECPGIVHGLCL